ncbi:putative reverse transcriptase domain-containing protein [Tanacetum coccineum]
MYPFPEQGEELASLMGYPYICFFRLLKEYSQIRMAEDDKEKTGFHTEEGVYCFPHMPKDLKNSAATLQMMMEKDVKEMLRKLKRVNIKIDPIMSSFGVKEGKFLGHMVTEEGLRADPERIHAIILSPTPRSTNQIRRLFLQQTAISKFILKFAVLKYHIREAQTRMETAKEYRWIDNYKTGIPQPESIGYSISEDPEDESIEEEPLEEPNEEGLSRVAQADHQESLQDQRLVQPVTRTRYGHFKFTVMPFGLTNAPAVLMNLINQVCKSYLDKFVIVFIDDVVIYSKSKKEHEVHLKIGLELLKKEKLFAKFSKCEFWLQEVHFLRRVVNSNDIHIDSNNIKVMKNWKVPKTPYEIRAFLGLACYYRCFIENFSKIAKTLTSLTQRDQKGKVIADASRQLNIYEKILTIHNFERGAVVFALKTWRHYLYGTKSVIYTDHKSLQHIFDQKELYMRQQRWIELFSDFDSEIHYHPRKANVVADALSRKEIVKPRRVRAMSMTISQVLRTRYWLLHVRCPRLKHQRPSGLFQQHEIPKWKCDKNTMDFITKLPRSSSGHNTIWIIVDRLTKSAHFLVIREDYSMEKLARLYIDEIVARHGVPVLIFSDRDRRFTSRFWQTLQKALGMRLDMSTAYHTQMDGLNKRRIQTLEDMLRASPVLWAKIGESGLIGPELVQETNDKVVLIKEKLKAARDRQKSYADNRRNPLEFKVGDQVLLKVSPWKGVI